MAQALLFLPDISGFTDFVTHTEIQHSQHIIAELLEILIESNSLDLELAEIEGDALFFYKQDQLPSYLDLLKQVKSMFLAFHNHLRLYDHQRICNCGACQSAAQLSLKFFAHTGNIEFINLKGFKKPHGKEVILAHRLMKNSVPKNEYLLISHTLREKMEKTEQDVNLVDGSDTYDAGEVNYQYLDLTNLKQELAELPRYTGPLDSSDPILVSGSIKVPPKELLELVSNLEYRHLWNQGVTEILFDKNRVNRQGEEHVCVINGKQVVLETVSKPKKGDQLIYGEKTKEFPLMKNFTNYFVIEPNMEGSTLSIEGHLHPKNWIGIFAKPLFKKRLKSGFQKILENLKVVAENENPLAISTVE